MYWGDPERHRLGRLNLLKARTAVVRLSLEKLGCGDEVIAGRCCNRLFIINRQVIKLFPECLKILSFNW